jgi:hypothetical protein
MKYAERADIDHSEPIEYLALPFLSRRLKNF